MRPKVPSSHAIGRRAVHIVQGLLPETWTQMEPREGEDYGFDLLGGIARTGQMSSEQFALQIKGTNVEKPPGFLRLARSTVAYLSELTHFVAAVKVHVPSGRVWMVPLHDHRFTTAAESDSETLSIRLVDHDEATTSLGDRIDVLTHREWCRLARLRRNPVWVRAVGWNSAQDVKDLNALRAELPFWIRVEPSVPAEGHLVQAVLHRGPPPCLRDSARPTRPLEFPVPSSTGIAAMGLMLGAGFQDLRMVDAAIELYRCFLPKAPEARFDQGMTLIFDLMLRELGIEPVMEILKRAVTERCYWSAGLVSYLNLYWTIPEEYLPLAQQSFSITRMRSLDWGESARLYMNESYLLSRNGRLQEALQATQVAARCHPGYLTFPHWWRHAGGLFVDLGDLQKGDRYYEKAIELGGAADEVLPLRIEIALRTGEFLRVARLTKVFNTLKADPFDMAWVQLMAGVASRLLEEKRGQTTVAPDTLMWQSIAEAIRNPRDINSWAAMLSVVLSTGHPRGDFEKQAILAACRFHGAGPLGMLRGHVRPEIGAELAQVHFEIGVIHEHFRRRNQNEVQLPYSPRLLSDGEFRVQGEDPDTLL